MAEEGKVTNRDFTDTGQFLGVLQDLESRYKDHIYFRGQTNADWCLLPTSCRGNSYVWADTWIEHFIAANRKKYLDFGHFRWQGESDVKFARRFELALRAYIEHEIIHKFQQLLLTKKPQILTDQERLNEASFALIAQYLSSDSIPVAKTTLYGSLLAQHHGIPTRLLDWTSSLGVALGFATSAETSGESDWKSIAVWVLIPWDSSRIDPEAEKDEFTFGGTLALHDEGALLDGDEIPGVLMDIIQPRVFIMQGGPLGDGFRPVGLGRASIRLETPLPGTGLKFLDPRGIQMGDIYVASQRSLAMVDMRHDRCFYRDGKWQPIDERLAQSYIPTGRVFKFTLPLSELDDLRREMKPNPIKRAYSSPMFEEHGSFDEDSDTFEEDLQTRKCNFLNAVGKQIRTDIEWDAIQV